RKLGLTNLRVRSEGDTARIELSPEQIKEFVLTTELPQLVGAFQKLGFVYVTLDLEGYRSGKLNQVLQKTGLI
ncbi:MAG: TIGR00268 family protein, partial [Coleofasciculaceae cyanobacterium]